MERHMRFVITALAALIVLLGMQLLSRQGVFDPRIQGPRLGQPLPALHVVNLKTNGTGQLNDLLTASASCTLVVFVSRSCSYCQRMRASWQVEAAQMRSDTEGSVRTVWLSAGSDDQMREFYAGFDMSGTDLWNIPTSQRGALAVQRSLGVWGSPTIYVVDETGHLKYGKIGVGLPAGERLKRACGRSLRQ